MLFVICGFVIFDKSFKKWLDPGVSVEAGRKSGVEGKAIGNETTTTTKNPDRLGYEKTLKPSCVTSQLWVMRKIVVKQQSLIDC